MSKTTSLVVSLCALVMLAQPSLADTGLLVQSNAPWGATDPGVVMSSLSIPFDQIGQSGFAAQSLAGYSFILLQGSDGEADSFDAYIAPNMNKVQSYVENGGLAIVHYADWNAASVVIAPTGVQRVHVYDETGNIVPGFEGDPLFTDVTDASLDGWFYTSHGYLTGLPGNADVLTTNSTGEPIYARYGMGLGQVWVTTMTLEWGQADPDVLRNELALAGDFAPVPIPAAALLAVLGMGTAGLRLRRFV
jgi:hypothetical protein